MPRTDTLISEGLVLQIAEALRVAYLRGRDGEDMTETIHELRDWLAGRIAAHPVVSVDPEPVGEDQ